MRVRIDLRPHKRVETEAATVRTPRLIVGVLCAIVLLLAVANAGFALFQLHRLRQEAETTRADVASLEDQFLRIGAELGDLRSRVTAYETDVRFALSDLPHLEFLTALEALLPKGVVLEKIEIRPGTALVSGYAESDREVVDFAKNLQRAATVSGVPMPAPVEGERLGRKVRVFSLTLGLLDLPGFARRTESPQSEDVPR
jgi:hypothetical protein